MGSTDRSNSSAWLRWVTAGTGALLLSAGAMAQTVKIGSLFPASGPFASFGIACSKGVDLAVEEANAAGGIKGQKIELKKADAADPSQAVSEARRLISAEGVKAMFGTYSSGLAYAASPVAELAGIPYFELTGTADNITERKFKYLFRASAPASQFGAATMTALQEIVLPHYKLAPKTAKVAIIHEDGLYGTTVAKNQAEIAEKAGIPVVVKIPYSAKTVDLSAAVLQMKKAGAEVVMHTGYQNDVTLLSRQMDEASFKPVAIVGGGAGYSLIETRKAVGAKMDGIVTVDFASTTINGAGAKDHAGFMDRYKKKYNEEPSLYAQITYAGAKSFIAAMNKAKSLERDDVRAAVLALDEPVGTQATGYGAKYNESGQNTRTQMIIMQWINGELKAIHPKAVALTAPVFKQP